MKVLMIDSLVGNDYSICLCNSLKNAGIDVYLTATEDRKISVSTNFTLLHWAPTKGQHKSKGRKSVEYLQYHIRLLNFIFKNNINVIHYQFFRRYLFDSLFFLFLKLLNRKLVFTAHNIMPHENRKFHYLLNSIIYKYSNKIIVHSNFVKNILKEKFQFDYSKIAVIPHGNFDVYQSPLHMSQKEARKNLALSDDDNVLLFFGYIRKYKGLDLLLDGFEIAQNDNMNLKLVIAGTPGTKQLENEYKKRVAEISKNGNIKFHSTFIPTDQVAQYFIAADIVMLPYKNIFHSGLMHLAYSFGKPIIATNVGDFSETIEHGKSGFVLASNDAANLSQAIISAFSNKTKLSEMGKYSKKISNSKYSWDNIANLTKKLYDNISD
jgi:D-inositol-3-phosphate glycosyltransferase